MPKDELELLLERCRESLSEIRLDLPTLESAAPRPTDVDYFPAPPAPPPKAPVAPPKPPEPPPPPPPPTPEPPAVEERAAEETPAPPPLLPKTPPPAPAWPESKPAAPSNSKPSFGGRRRVAAAASAAAALGALGVWMARRPAADLDIDAGAADAMAVRPEKGDLLLAQGKELVDVSLDGRTLERQPLDAPVESLRWEQGSLWSADGRTESVVERAESGRATVFRLNHAPDTIYVKDKYLWTAEKEKHALHQFLISRSILGALVQPLDSFDLNGLSPETFTFDDAGTLWLVDEPTRRLYRLRLDNGTYRKQSWAPLSPFVGPEGALRGLTIEGGSLWILARPAKDGRAALRRISLGRLDWTSA